MFRLPNRIFLTLNVFDFRIKMSASVKLRRKGLSSLVHFKGFSLAKINSRANLFKLKQSKLVYKFLNRELRTYRKLPWLIKNYRINLYSKMFKGKKTKNLLTFSQQLYRKKFFLAYYLYINSLSSKLISKNLLHTSLQHFFFQILDNYEFFLKKIKDSSLL